MIFVFFQNFEASLVAAAFFGLGYGAYTSVDWALATDVLPPTDEAGDPSLDAVFLSPHKFLGGPGSSGLLLFNKRCYHSELPPSMAGGGTVDYVGPEDHDFISDIESREKAGTPGILQTLRASLALQLKAAVGIEQIEQRESTMTSEAFRRWGVHPRIEILGNPDPARRVGIISFNLRDTKGQYLHPRFVTTLLNDLFGIQTRAGCSCAGPYGHQLLDIDPAKASEYRNWISRGYHGIKPGWCRVGFHYAFDQLEADYLLDCIEFVADHGQHFVHEYHFDARDGRWQHRRATAQPVEFSLRQALEAPPAAAAPLSAEVRSSSYAQALDFAHSLAAKLARQHP